MREPLRNIGASVRTRLLKLSKERNQPFEILLTRYVLERLLYRLSTTKHRERFALKGAILMTTWFDDPHRPTRDLDLLGFGDPNRDAMTDVFREIFAVTEDDAVTFGIGGFSVSTIRDDQEYSGLRIKTKANVDGARVPVVIDVAFGDAIEPGLAEMKLPVLLDQPAPKLRAYRRETVIAEKFQAMVMLGLANSRMKDFYDIWLLSRSYKFDDDKLARAIAATFARRNTPIPTERPDALSRAFVLDPAKKRQWAAFVQDVAVEPGELADVVDALSDFLMPHAAEAREIATGAKSP